MKSTIDIFSEDFFAEDPFGDNDDNDGPYIEPFESLSLELYTVEESMSHVHESLSEGLTGEEAASACSYSSTLVEDCGEQTCNRSMYKSDEGVSPQTNADDTETNTTSRSTDFESTDLTNHNPQSPRASPDQEPKGTRAPHECTSAACAIRRLTIQQQEQQIRFLRQKLQEYADLCAEHNIGQDLLSRKGGAALAISSDRSARTNYEDQTYADLMGPWDIPFHVDVKKEEIMDNSDEYSGITFAQHPSKIRDTAQRIRPCPTDDDDALPVIRRPYQSPSRWTPKPSRQESGTNHADLRSNRVTVLTSKHSLDMGRAKLQLPSLEKAQPTTQPEAPNHKEQEARVKSMQVIIERKYGRQRALYSGTILPDSGCPHGAGTLKFVKSGDVYIGEISYGEMHGKGTYLYKKSQQLFRGTFVRNTFVGKDEKKNLKEI